MSLSSGSKASWLLYVKLLLTVLSWGMAFVATKFLIPHVSPLSVVFSRVLIGFFVLAFLVKRRGLSLKLSRDLIPWFIFFGIIAVYMHQWVQAYALYTSKASTATWIVATAPIFIAILGKFLLKERLSYIRVIGICISFFGVLMVVGEGNISKIFNRGVSTLGDVIILATSFNWAFFSVISRFFLKRHREIPQLVVVFYTILFGLLLTGATFVYVGNIHEIFAILSDIRLLIAIAFLGVFCTGLAYAFWYDALDVLEASKVGAFMNIQPVVGMIGASIVLGESISLFLVIGGILILLGVYLVNRY